MSALDLIKKLKKYDFTPIEESEIMNVKEPIRTMYPVINLALSGDFFGGLETGTTVLAGPSSSFKTAMLLTLARAFQQKYPEGIVIFIDSEGGTNPNMLRNFGIDTERLIITRVMDIGEMHNKLQTVLQDNVTPEMDVFVAVDSIGNVATAGEVERAKNNKISADVGNRAKELKSLFRTVSPYIRHNKVYAVFLNHTYDPPEMYAKRVMSGGSGSMYDAQTVIFLDKVAFPSDLKPHVGEGDSRFSLYIHKSRKVAQYTKFFINVYQGRGIDPTSHLLDLAKEAGVLKHYHGPYWDYFTLDKETGEMTPTRVSKSEMDTPKFWAGVLKDEYFNELVQGKYLLQTDEAILLEENDIFGYVEECEVEDNDKKGKKSTKKAKSDKEGEAVE